MNNMPNVSIILPVYKTECFLEQCLESVVNQTLNSIEIIIVHDAPSSKETEIIKHYLDKDNRIKYIVNETPVSLGKARNQGFEIATGEYFGCVDTDDWIALDMFEKLYKKAKLLHADISFCGIRTIDNKNNFTNYELSDNKLLKYKNQSFMFDDVSESLFNLHCNAFNRIYRSDFYKKANLHYPENIKFEDVVIYFEGLLKAKSICFVNECLYNYRIERKGSIKNNTEGHYLAITTFLNGVLKVFKDTNKYEQYKYRLITFFPQVYHWYSPNEKLYNFIKSFLKEQNLNKNEIKNLRTYKKQTLRILKFPYLVYKFIFQRGQR